LKSFVYKLHANINAFTRAGRKDIEISALIFCDPVFPVPIYLLENSLLSARLILNPWVDFGFCGSMDCS
jgi:hypothetical protein